MGTLIDSEDVAFRQHQYGHTPAPNWPYFIKFAQKEFSKADASSQNRACCENRAAPGS
jgi:hypothetical protein